MPPKNSSAQKKGSVIRYFWVVVLIIAFFISHVPRLGTDEMNPDAVNWHWRSEQYLNAIKSGDFKNTYRHYHPGVTLTLIAGVPAEILKRTSDPRLIYDRFTYEVFHFVAKYFLIVVLLLLTILMVYNLTKVFGFRVALLAGFLLTLEPFMLGNSRLLHLDALVTMFLINGLI
ncbi:hypothetical protein HY419_00925, partial [candidate division WWE3 bacterium]|nr:hypothetical protein [candidate division WWE3 bacterium]